MTEQQKLLAGVEFAQWIMVYIGVTVLALLAVIVYRKLMGTRGSLAGAVKVGKGATKVFALILGMSLLLVSSIMNAKFGLMIAEAFPAYPTVGRITAVMMGLGNLAAIFAIKQSVERQAMGDIKGMWMARAKWGVITAFSLMTASSILLTANNSIRDSNTLADAKVARNERQIAINEERAKDKLSMPSADTAKFQTMTVKNSNGVVVPLTRVCAKDSGWYYTKYAECREYRLALRSSGAAQESYRLKQQNVALDDANIAMMESKGTVFKPSIFGMSVDEKWAFFWAAVFLEIAAEVSLAYAFSKTHAAPASIRGTGQAGTKGSVPIPDKADPVQSGADPSKNKDLSSSKTNPAKSAKSTGQFHKSEPKPALRKSKSAALIAMTNPFADAVTDGEVDDLLFQLATENPQTNVTSGEINAVIAAHRQGKGVKQDRILAAFRRNKDVVLEDTSGGRPKFILRDVNGGKGPAQQAAGPMEPAGVNTLSALPGKA